MAQILVPAGAAVDLGTGHSVTNTTTQPICVTNTTTQPIWLAWNETITATTTAAIWNVWTDNSTTTLGEYEIRPFVANPARQPIRNLGFDLGETPEQRAARHAEAERRQAETVRIEGERALARQKAQALLDRALSEPQREQLKARGFFELDVISKSGERRRYRIKRGRHGNVHRLDEQGREVRRFCIHPLIQCPDEDTMLTQKLWLENDEELFLRTANAS